MAVLVGLEGFGATVNGCGSCFDSFKSLSTSGTQHHCSLLNAICQTNMANAIPSTRKTCAGTRNMAFNTAPGLTVTLHMDMKSCDCLNWSSL